jgi:hypothetical protein
VDLLYHYSLFNCLPACLVSASRASCTGEEATAAVVVVVQLLPANVRSGLDAWTTVIFSLLILSIQAVRGERQASRISSKKQQQVNNDNLWSVSFLVSEIQHRTTLNNSIPCRRRQQATATRAKRVTAGLGCGRCQLQASDLVCFRRKPCTVWGATHSDESRHAGSLLPRRPSSDHSLLAYHRTSLSSMGCWY